MGIVLSEVLASSVTPSHSLHPSNRMRTLSLLLVALLCITVHSFNFRTLNTMRMKKVCAASTGVDPNFEAHLPELLKRGTAADRPDADIAEQLRKRYRSISSIKKEAAKVLRSTGTIKNIELAQELEEIADDLNDTHEKFVALSESWDSWNRPDPDIARKLRQEAEAKKTTDPNFIAHLPQMMAKGSSDRPSADLPSELRMLKYKQMASVKRIASQQIKNIKGSEKLSQELAEIADEIEESHNRFEEMAKNLNFMKNDSDLNADY